MKKTIILIGHPHFEKSTYTKKLVNAVVDLAPHVDTKMIPTDKINVKQEQDVLASYDNIIFAFPIWWYSAPWNVKRYLDEVFSAGFAFSYRGRLEDFKLLNKKFSFLVSVGNVSQTYQEGAMNRHTINRFLDSYIATFNLAATGGVVANKNLPDSAFLLRPGIAYGAAVEAYDSQAEIAAVAKDFAEQL